MIDGTTTTVKTVAFTAAHAYLRIKHDQATNQVVFETAGADANGWPGPWTEQKRLAWDATVPLVDVQVELKAATTGATANPGLVTFDHVEITRYLGGGVSCKPTWHDGRCWWRPPGSAGGRGGWRRR